MTDQAPGIAVLPMTNVEFENGAFSVDAAVIAAGLKVEARLVYSGVRDGTITTRCERGVAEDAGRYRLSFFHGARTFSLLVDESGKVIQRSAIDLGARGSHR
ncbi:MAG: DUF6522 family protein [Gammaproteobacteria bacterium]